MPLGRISSSRPWWKWIIALWVVESEVVKGTFEARAEGGADYGAGAGAAGDHGGEGGVDEGDRGAEVWFEVVPPVGEVDGETVSRCGILGSEF
jgi:hypothetical protein